MNKKHSFHIPVMGIGFTVDTPLKVSYLGIDSVISLVDDILLEKLRKMYCSKNDISYEEISDKEDDFRAKRITSYLNLMKSLAEQKFNNLKNSALEAGNDFKKYFDLMPANSSLKKEFENLISSSIDIPEIRKWIKENLSMGSIDVNIMTKVDKDNYKKDDKLPVEYNDAHAALRGFANSELQSSVIFSAGMNPRLYSYAENFDDFYPNENGEIKKKIILKVSDYRSALIQGKFLAKKGLWVSEYRIESGLNCGGHAFATDGYLLGPVLAEFKEKREELSQSINELFVQALETKNRTIPKILLPLRITAQGGVGTAEEHQFLLDEYEVDSVGWGTPFLLVPEATTVDSTTRNKLVDAKEKDIYLSNISPLGVPFYSLKGNTKDSEKFSFIEKGRPGSSCPKKFVALNKEYSEKGECTASRVYQHQKLKELNSETLSTKEYQDKFDRIVEKSCTCVGLGTSALLAYGLDTKTEGPGVSICPGPGMAYFSKLMSLKEMTEHIYGRINVINREDRPSMFIKELNIYIDFLKSKLEESTSCLNKKQEKYFVTFIKNLNDGINYYNNLFKDWKGKLEGKRVNILHELNTSKEKLQQLNAKLEQLTSSPVIAS